MTNARTFAIKIDKAFDDLLEKDFLPFKQKIAMEALQRVTKKMPVDTGRAKGNTIVSLGSMDNGTVEVDDKTPLGSYGAAVWNGVPIIDADRDPFGMVFVQNNLPYINRLENGYSIKQAPLGMFALTVAELEVMFL